MLTEYIGNVNAVETGHVFVVAGKTIDAAARLDLNLLAGKNKEDNVILQISVRFRDNLVVRNSRVLGEWGDEEIEQNLVHTNAKSPLVPGEKFKFFILMDDTKFHIALNNQRFCAYNYRMPVEDVRTIELTYDLQVVSQVDHRAIYPCPMPALQCEEPNMVFSNDVPRLFRPGHVIVITGIPYGNPKGWFFLRFTEGVSKKQAFHLSVRFDPQFQVIRNTMDENSVFGEEQRTGGFPFVFNQQFKIAIAITDRDFRLAVNGRCHSMFPFRTFNQLDKLNGFRVGVSYGMHIEITGVDHLALGPGGHEGFELYSSPKAMIF